MEDNYFIYLSFNNQAEGWRLPVNPESIEISEEGQGKTYNIVGKGGGTEETRAGEINVIQSPRLKTVSFSSFFPSKSHNYPFIVKGIPELTPNTPNYRYLSDGIHDPMKYVKDIRKWMETKHPIRFMYIVRRRREDGKLDNASDRDLNFPASIEKFEWKEVAGSPGDIEYSLSLKEYVFYSARNVQPVMNAKGETVLVQQQPARPNEGVMPETHIFQDGDSLTKISTKYYGDSARAREIQELNGISDSEVEGIQNGTVLKLPPK
ncbi:LysM domain-containing protein [Paenibacillus tianmuensis]|uniref:LysM domain-containing protein n=1 Tax=Paenibacillus tianmuensis TaxID=624147 RepID=A0A1G4RK11_9BACL|nr:LysM domain-containing protein [Paenibacillus tianmuensis]SCW57204.1 LysM domain-containing protein [Paenibacillus tianmuensis]